MYKIFKTNSDYVLTTGDPTQVIRGNLSDMLKLWARMETFVRNQQTDGSIDITDPLANATDALEMGEALEVAVQHGHTIKERTLRWNLNAGNVPGAVKDGGRWQIPRGLFVEWLNRR